MKLLKQLPYATAIYHQFSPNKLLLIFINFSPLNLQENV